MYKHVLLKLLFAICKYVKAHNVRFLCIYYERVNNEMLPDLLLIFGLNGVQLTRENIVLKGRIDETNLVGNGMKLKEYFFYCRSTLF